MALGENVVIPFTGFYLGDASATSSRLVKIRALRSPGATYSKGFPVTWIPSLSRFVRSGNLRVSVSLTLLGDSETLVRIANGLSITTPGDINAPSPLTMYSMLLLSGDATTKSSFYFPNIQVETVSPPIYGKNGAVARTIQFAYEVRDINTQIVYQDTLAALISVMGAKSPV